MITICATDSKLKPGDIVYLDGVRGMAKMNGKYYHVFDATAQKVSLKKQRVVPKKGHTFPRWSLVPWIAAAAVIGICYLLGFKPW